jgi:integrase/recombinase XerD
MLELTPKIGRPTKAETKQRSLARQQKAGRIVAKKRKIPEYFTQREIELLLQNAPNPDCAMSMMLGWRAGLRISESLNLRLSNVNRNEATLRIEQGKGGKDRVVPLHPELSAFISNHVLYTGRKGLLIVNGDRTTHWRWYKSTLQAIPELFDKHITTHSFRHSAARHWLASGVPINQVSLWLGHASIHTTLIYLQVLPDPTNLMERVP